MSHSGALPSSQTPPVRKAPPVSATATGAQWLRRHWFAFTCASLLVITPSFWHHYIQACDLSSHLYNAWLANSLVHSHTPGLHIERQFTNVFLDLLLYHLLPACGPVLAERLAVSLCVLVFFWGSFAFASALADRVAWPALPLLMMFSYGVIYHLGFFNFYLSAGFSLLALAIIFRGIAVDLVTIAALSLLTVLAHPMGAGCLVVLGIYLFAIRQSSPAQQVLLSVGLFLAALFVRTYLVHHYLVLRREVNLYWLLGLDQVVVFGGAYVPIAFALFLLCVAYVLDNLHWRHILSLVPAITVYALIALTVFIAPGGLFSDETFGMMGYLPDRGSVYAAAALAAVICACRTRRWFVLGCSAIAVVFFVALYRDGAILDHRETRVAELVRPYTGHRFLSLLPPLPGRIHEDHTLDLACIGRCYAYSNYEPSSMQFRLHADPGNRVVAVDQEALDAMEDGSYVVQPHDLPLFEVYQCGKGWQDICITELRVGQHNGDVPNLAPPPGN